MVPLTRVGDAHLEVERDRSVGKVVLAISEDGLVAM